MNRAETGLTDRQAVRVGALIRARRHSLRMTLRALSDLSGISIGYLSQVERDQALPSLSTLAAVARALDVGVDYFIATPSTQDALTRSGERIQFSVGNAPIIYEKLHAEFPGSALSAFLITIQPGYRSETASHEGEEIIYVMEGELTLRIEDDLTVVAEGDSLHFRGNRSHSWSNETNSAVRLVWSGNLTMFRSNQDGSAFQTAHPAPITK